MNKFMTIIFILCFYNFATQGQTKIDSLLNLLKSIKHDTIKIKALADLSDCLRNKDTKKAIEYGMQGLHWAERINFRKGISDCCNNIGIIYIKQGDYLKALQYLQKSLAIRISINDKKGVAANYINIGNIYCEQSNYLQALIFYQKSLKLFEALNIQTGFSNCLMNIGIVHDYQNNYPLALEYYNKSLKVFERLKDKAGISNCLNNIGGIYEAQCNYPIAIEYYQKALKIDEEEVDKMGASKCLHNLGGIYATKGNYPLAIKYYQKSLKIKEELKNKSGIAVTYGNISELKIKLKEYGDAIDYAQKSLIMAKDINALQTQRAAYLHLSDANDSLKNYKEAHAYYKLFFLLNDSIYKQESNKQIIEMQTKYETEKKQKEINLLTKEKKIQTLELERSHNFLIFIIIIAFLILILTFVLFNRYKLKLKTSHLLEIKNKKLVLYNEKITKSEAELKELNATKNKFFSIISHDLRNPLSSIKSSMGILYENPERFSVEKIKMFSGSIHYSIDNVINLFENLLTWSKSETKQMVFEPVDVDLQEIIQPVIRLFDLKIQQKQLDISLSIAENTEIHADKNMLAFILRNLLDNAVKFSENKGRIRICSNFINDNFIEISVSDNGKGIPQEHINKIFDENITFTTSGTYNEKGSGLGLILCKEFVIRNSGNIWVESKINEGTTFYFTLPVSMN